MCEILYPPGNASHLVFNWRILASCSQEDMVCGTYHLRGAGCGAEGLGFPRWVPSLQWKRGRILGIE